MPINVNKNIYKAQADFCLIFANEKRLMIMDFLSDGEKSVGEIAQAINFSIQNVSQHLRVMRETGALTNRKVGQTVYYRISNPKFMKGCHIIREAIIEQMISKADAALSARQMPEGRGEGM
ncbi:MAG: hypothetical protein Kow0090_10360 [Myxococcota bacterium]